jgi:hypothetical protein
MVTSHLIVWLILWAAIQCFVSPLFGNSTLGYYHVNVYLGPQADEQSLIFDTGSDATLVDCSMCIDCGTHQHQHYVLHYNDTRNNPNHFHSFECRDPSCRFTQSYSEGSTYYGTYVRESVRFHPNKTGFDAVIGCVSAETGLFITQDADGILGACPTKNYPETVSSEPLTLLDAAISEGKVTRNIISLCLAKDGGFLGFGDSLDHLERRGATTKTVAVDSPFWENYYKIPLTAIKIGSLTLSIDNLAHLDSGTTLTYFPVPVHAQILKEIKSACLAASGTCAINDLSNKCFQGQRGRPDADFYSSLPTILFTFAPNTTIEWAPKDYLVKSESGHFCLLIESGDSVTLGASFMTSKHILLDRDAYRVSFTDADCTSTTPKEYRHLIGVSNRYNHALNQIVATVDTVTPQSVPVRPSIFQSVPFRVGLLLVFLSLVVAVVVIVIQKREPAYRELKDDLAVPPF